MQSLFLADQMGALGYRVVNVGAPDLLYGLDKLRETATKNGFQLVSTNIVRRDSGQPEFDPMVLMNVKGIKLAFLGVIGGRDNLESLENDLDDLTIRDPNESLLEWVPKAREEADVVVLFAHIGSRRAQRIVDEVKGIDIAIAGGDGFMNNRAVEVGNDEVGRSLVLQAGDRGKWIGAFNMVVSEHGKILRYTHELHGLDQNIPENEAMAEKVKVFKEELRQVRKREAVESVVGETQSAAPSEQFLGSNVCKRCHEAAFEVWDKSKHAHSMESLEGQETLASSGCLQCHVTGHQLQNGYTANRSELANVSCEQCHGFGTLHGDPGFVARPTAESCIVCHDQQNSPHFDYNSYWKAIAH